MVFFGKVKFDGNCNKSNKIKKSLRPAYFFFKVVIERKEKRFKYQKKIVEIQSIFFSL